ncbi:hypothetical protein D6777_03520 [Candidatus Woesearchaeota archaeon]|nr:MAG: hypothetical protein D6777_03520 [Candidatus Woesearchaeota archaeon]
MKRGLVFFLIFLAGVVAANTVDNFYPDNIVVNNHTVNFSCNFSTDINVTKVNLYLGNASDFSVNKSLDFNTNESNASFVVQGIENGTYLWGCEAVLENGSRIVGENKTFEVKVEKTSSEEQANLPPNQTKGLPELVWNKSTSFTLNLSEYFEDEDELEYVFYPMARISVEVNNDIANFTPMKGWSGKVNTTLNITDGEYTINTTVFLNVKNPDAINRSELKKEVPRFYAESIEPLETTYSMLEDSLQLKINVNEDAENVSYKWYVNGVEQNVNSDSFSYTSQHNGESVTIKVLATDAYNQTVEKTWVIKETSCFDGLLNGNEEKIDCGGSCQPCVEEKPEPECGNGVRESGENCLTCPEDATCSKGFVCSENGNCVKEEKSFAGLVIGIIIGVIVLLMLTGFLFKLIQKKVESKVKKEENKIKPLTEVEKPNLQPTETKPTQDNVNQQKPEQPTNMNQSVEQPGQLKPEQTGMNVQEQKTEQTQMKQPQQTGMNVQEQKQESQIDPQLKEFIEKMRSLGKSDEEIKAKLKANGWTDDEIRPAFN